MSLQQNQEAISIMEQLVEYFNQYVFISHKATLERFQTTLPAITIKSQKQLTKSNTSILGDYCASMQFGIVIRIAKDQQPNEVHHIVDDVVTFLENARHTNTYPVLRDELRCCSIEQSSNVELQQVQDDGSEDYIATFTLKYQKINTFN